MQSKTAHSLIIILILMVGHLTSVTAVTDAELEALEKQIEQKEAEEIKQSDTELESLEKQIEQQEVEEQKQAEADAKRKAEQKRKSEAEAEKKRLIKLEKQHQEEQKRLEAEKRKLKEARQVELDRKRQEEETKRLAVFPQPRTWNIGDATLVNWSKDGYWYPATVVKKEGERHFVIFDDGDKEWTTLNRMTEEDMREGDRVFGNWQKRGKYYPGKITQRKGSEIHIKYDDGDEEWTTISVVRVLRPRIE